MDKELSITYRHKQKQRKILIISAISISVLIAYYTFYTFLQPTINKTDFQTATVENGPMIATLTGSGVVIPELEQIITSPIQAKIEAVLHNSGEQVHPGESILTLDKEYSLLAYDKLKDEQALNKNKIIQLKLSLQKALNDLETQQEIKQLKIKSLETFLSDEIALHKIGGSSQENVEQARMNLQIARLEQKQLTRQIAGQHQAMKADQKALALQINIGEKTMHELESKIKQAEIRATRKGVITWVHSKIGATVNAADELVRIADLGSFKIEGSIADAYAGKVKPELDVVVRVNEQDLQGTITNVYPSVEDGVVKFNILLKDKANPVLRPNQKGEVFVITAVKAKAIRVKNGPVFNGSAMQDIFVIKGNKAFRRKVHIGDTNADYVEIVDGLGPGEKIIITDMTEYKAHPELSIR